MRFFFRSRQFKIIISIFAGVVVLAVIFGIMGARMEPGASLFGTITAPIREASSEVFGSIKDLFGSMKENNKLLLEKAELESEVNELRKEVAEAESVKEQNKLYKEFLGLKDEHPDFELTEAYLVSRDSDDIYGSFVINRGYASGIHKYDPVISSAGLVGFVTEVGVTTSKVTTILSPDISLGALCVRTSDSGIINGEYSLADKGFTKLTNLSRNCSIAVGDYMKTSGEGIFPEGILIGTVETVGTDKYNSSVYAEIKPFADISSLKGVMVITNFNGKGGVTVGTKGSE